jgi:two-component system, OmpR family, sensor kinase
VNAVAPARARQRMARFRSLRWRLTFVYLALLASLLLLGGVAQYFAAREVLFRTNAEVLVGEYTTVFNAFRRQNAGRPTGALRALLVSKQFTNLLGSGRTAAAIFDLNGGLVVRADASLTSIEEIPTLTTQDYLDAVARAPKPYYLATAGDGSSHLVVLNVIRNGSRPLAIAQLSIPTNEIDQTLRADRQLAIIGSVLVLLLALVLSPLIVGRALGPLEQMSATAGALAAGDYKQRVAVPPTNDEIGKLALAFNQMAAGIDQAFTVRREAENEMRHFVADASHELRTPLTSIAGYIDVLSRRDTVDSATLQASLSAMRRESDRMTRLVNDLLTLTRFEAGKTAKRQRLELGAFVGQALDELGLKDRGVPESRHLQPGLAVNADPEALKQVVANLAQNAIKYAPGTEQRWSVFESDGRAAIRLQDQGPGIARQDLPHVFERFYRGDKARERSAGGSGLGLAIAKSVMEAHEGTIEASSDPGQGATFTAWLPLAA